MLTIEGAQCRICGTQHAADAVTCPVCGAKTNASSVGKAGAKSARPRPTPFGLDSATLLAKIDALDWEEPTIQAPVVGAAPTGPSLPPKRSLLLPFLAGFAVLLVGMLALRYYSGNRASPVVPAATESAAQPAAATPTPVAEAPATAAPVEPVAATPPGTEPAPALTPEDEERVKQEEARRKRAELKRKALAAKQALEEQGRLEKAEQERLRAEREAAEARARAAAVAVPAAPRGPASPQEICAGEANPFSRNICESRTCALSQWRGHPFCMKRWQDELRKLSPGAEN